MLTVKQQQFLLNNEGLIEGKPRLLDLRDAALSQGLSSREAVELLILYAEVSKLYYFELSDFDTMDDHDYAVRIILINSQELGGDYATICYKSFPYRPSIKEKGDLLRSTISKRFNIRENQIPYLLKNIKCNTLE